MFIMWATGVEQGCASKVIWAILQAHPISSHKSHKAYKSYKTYNPYKTYKTYKPYKSYKPL